jgi:hypothetical protein
MVDLLSPGVDLQLSHKGIGIYFQAAVFKLAADVTGEKK